MHAFARERVQIRRQGRDQGLALAGAHFRDLARVQDHAADELHVEMAHVEHALGRLAHDGKGFRQQIVQCLALGKTLLELRSLGTQCLVRQRGNLGLEHVDALYRLVVTLDLPVVTAAENASQDAGGH